MSIDLHFGDAREVVAAMDPCSVHAVVTDNPYHLSFMGRIWDRGGADAIAYDPAFWALCRRVLKPGGHLVAFGAPRTHHRIWCAIEDAGFEIRDTLQWLRGKGYPKNYNVGRGIDERLGAEWTQFEENPASRPGQGGGAVTQTEWEQRERPQKPVLVTEEAKQWADHGTALKPAQEPILLARKPLAATIAQNVLEHGTGVLNIGACRVGTTKDVPKSPRRAPQKAAFGDLSQQSGETSGFDPTVGRWPPNVLLSHHPDCTIAGMRQVPTGTAVRRHIGKSSSVRTDFGANGKDDASLRQDQSFGEDGLEIIERWNCVPGCPVAELDRQSGPSGQKAGHTGNEPSMLHSGRVYDSPKRRVSSAPRDELGAASRFFPTFEYASPAATRERDAGCEDFYWQKAPRNTWVRVEKTKWETLHPKHRTRGNVHPTVKPISLMRWLVRLTCPSGGIVLDPFLGSGTTALACLLEGFSCVGVELDPDSYAIARARVSYHSLTSVHEHGSDLPCAPTQIQRSLF